MAVSINVCGVALLCLRVSLILLVLVVSLGTSLAQTHYRSRAITMNWSETGNWDIWDGDSWEISTTYPGEVAGAGDVTIQDGHTVTIDVSPAQPIARLFVRTSGVLQYEANTARTLAVSEMVRINQGGIFRSALIGTVTTHQLEIGGSIVNNGTLDFSTTAGALGTTANAAGAGITFTGNSSGLFDLSTAIRTNLRASDGLILNGTGHLSFTPGGQFEVLSANAVGFLTIQSGTFSLIGENPFSNPLFHASTGSYTIPSGGGFRLDNPNATISGIYGTLTNNGEIIIRDGVFNVGDGTGNESLTTSTGRFEMSGGEMNISGRFRIDGGLCIISGGTLNLATIGHANRTLAAFHISASATLTISGNPLITFAFPNSNTTPFNDIEIVAGIGLKTITGGTFQLGTDATPSTRPFLVNSDIPIHDLVVYSADTRVVLSDHLTINNHLTLNGRLSMINYNLNIGAPAISGNFSNTTGMIVPGTGEVQKAINSNGSYVFPFGTSEYLPVNLNFTGGTFTSGATVSVRMYNTKHPQNVNTNNYLRRYWTVSTTGITNPVYNFSGTYTTGDIFGQDAFMTAGIYTSAWKKITPSINGNFIINANGLTGNVAITGINAAAAPVVTATAAPTSICSGSTVQLTTTATGVGPFTYSWISNPAGFTSTDANPSVSPTTTTTYTVTVTDGMDETTSASATVTVNPALPVSVSITSNDADNTICEGTSVTFTATPTNGGATPSFQWYVGATPVGTNSPTFTTATLTNGDAVSVRMTSTETCATGNPAISNVITTTVNPNLPVSVIIASDDVDNTICEGTGVTFTATPTNGGTPSYQWYVGANPVGTNSPTFTTTTLTTGQRVTVVMTSTQTCSTGSPATSNAISTTVNPLLPVSVSIAASTNPVCAGTEVTFTATPVNEGPNPTYQWRVNGNVVGNNSPNYSYNPSNGDIVTCILTSNVFCATGTPAESNQVRMTVNPLSPVSVNISASANSICAGTSVTFTATPINEGIAPIYVWKVNGLPVGGNSPIYSYIPSNNDAVTCELTSNATCVTDSPATSNQVTMTVHLLPTATISGTTEICQNEASPTVTFTASSGTAPYAFTYRINSGANQPITTNGNTATVTVPTGTPGDFIYTLVSVQDANCSQLQTGTASITIHPLPIATATSNSPQCIGSTLDLMASGGTAYLWTGPNGFTSNQQNPSIVNVSAAAAGTYTVTATDANGCVAVASTSVIINPTPTVNAIEDLILCNNTTAPGIIFSGPVAGTTFTWTNSNTAIGLAAGGLGNIPSFLTTNGTNSPISGSITVTPTANGCVGTPLTFTITVNPTPTVNTIEDRILCNNTTAPGIIFSGPVAGTTFQWTNSNTAIGLAASGSGSIPVFNTTNTTTGTLTGTITVTPTANGCVGTPLTFTITVNPTPTASISGGTTVCQNDDSPSITFTNPMSVPVTITYRRNSIAHTINVAASSTNTVAVPTITADTYTYELVTVAYQSNPTCHNNITGSAIVIVNPKANAVPTPGTQGICSGQAITPIVLSSSTTGVTYNWTRNNTATVTGIANSGSGNITGTLTNTTSAPVIVTFTITANIGDCGGTPENATVTVYPTPVASVIPAAQTRCSGEAISSIVPGSTTGGTTFTWTRDHVTEVTGLPASGTGPVPTVSLTNTTSSPITVTFTFYPTANNCEGLPVTATVLMSPKASIHNLPASICNSGTFNVLPVNGTDGVVPPGTTFEWRIQSATVGITGAVAGSGSSISGTLGNSTNFTQSVTYAVTPTNDGCIGELFLLTVTVTPEPAINTIARNVCSGNTFTVSPVNGTNGIVPTGTTYSWSAPTGGVSGGVAGSGSSITGTLVNSTLTPQTATYTVTPVSGTCTGNPFTLTVTVNPVAAVTPMSASVCSGESFTVTPVNGTNGVIPSGTTYSWTAPAVTGGVTGGGAGNGAPGISGTLTNPTSSVQTATYTVTPSSGDCAGATFTVTVTVNPRPAVNPMNITVCSGGSFNMIPVDGTNGSVPVGTTYSWVAPNVTGITGTASGTDVSSISGQLYNTSGTARNVTYSVTPSTGACAGTSFSVIVTVNPAPSVNNMVATVCSGTGFTITPVNGTNGTIPPGVTYSWSAPTVTGGITGGTSGSGAANISGTLINSTNTAQTATYVITPSSGSCTGNAFNLTVTVNPVPSVTISGDAEVCYGDTPPNITFTNPVNLPITVTYSINGGANFTVGIAASGTTSIPATVNQEGTFVYNVVSVAYQTAPTCSTPVTGTSATISVRPITTVVVSRAPSGTICFGEAVTFTSNVANAGTNPVYQWQLNGAAISGATGISYTSTTLNNADRVRLIVTTTDTPCPGPITSNEITMTVNPSVIPSVTIYESANPVCEGSSVTFTANPPVNGGTSPVYQWQMNGNNVGGNSSTYTTNTLVSGDQVRVILISNANCAVNPATSNTVTMVVNPNMPVSVTVAASANTVCAGTPVTFTATPTNGGTTPAYQWKVNGVNVGLNSSTYSYIPANNDVVTVVLTSNATCATGNPATSAPVTMTVNQNLPVSVTVAASANPVCSGTAVTFTATPTNGGTMPAYQWKVNNVNVGTDSNSYNYIPANGDVVTVELTSNATCATGSPATSAPVTMTVNPNLPVSVTVAASANPVCAGTAVTFTATPTNEGASPTYQWKVNGVNRGTNSSTYNYTPANDDVITVELTSNGTCAIGSPATSAPVTMTVTPSLPVSVSVAAIANPVCAGTAVTFTATPINGGTTPVYQWKVNGSNVGTNSNTYNYAPVNNDVVTVELTSNAACATGSPATSNTVTMTVNPNLPVSVTVAASANPVCTGTVVAFTATPTNGGATPAYQWKVNGVNVGTNSNTYSYTPANNDVVTVELTSNATCATGSPATSNSITLNVATGIPARPVAPTGLPSFCPPANGLVFTVPAVPGATSYIWSVLPTGWTIVSGDGTNSITVNVGSTAVAGTRTISVRASNACGTSIASPNLPVIVNTFPYVDAGHDIFVCAGIPNVNYTSPPGGATSGNNDVQWTSSSNAPRGNFTNNGTKADGTYTFTAADIANGSVTLTITSAPEGECNPAFVTDQVLVTIIPNPTVNAGGPDFVCQSATPSAITLTGASVGGGGGLTTGAWSIISGGGSLSSTAQTATPATITYTPAANLSGTVTLRLTTNTPGGCAARTADRTITINATPTVNPGGPNFVCQSATPSPITLTGASVGGGATTGAWSITSGGGTLSSTAQTATPATVTYTPAANFSGPVTLTLTTNVPSGCSAVSATRTITVNPTPTVNAGGPDMACQSTSPSAITLTGASVGGGATTGAWSIISGGGFLSNMAQTATPATVTYTPAANFSGTVTLRLTTNTPGGCAAVTADRTITVNPVPTVNAGSPDVVCQSATPSAITLSGATFGGGATTGTWSITSGGGTLSNTAPTAIPGTITYTPDANFSGTVTLTLTTNASGSCSAVSATRTITVNPIPTVNAGGPDVACQSATPSAIILTGANIGGGATTGAWSISAGGGTLSSTAQTSTPATVTYTPTANFSGTVTLTLTTNASSGCSAAIATRTITVNPAPTVSAGSPQTICSGSAVILAGSISGGATTGTWTGGGGTFNPDRNTLNASYTPSGAEIAAGTVTLTLTTTDSPAICGPVTATTTITINRAVVITSQPINTGACVGESAVLSVAADGTNLSYQWFKGMAPGTPISGATSSTLTINSVSLTDDGYYYVVVTGESPCSPITSNTITLNVDAAIAITSQPANQTRCEEENVTFSVTADAGGAPLTYQWRKNGVHIPGAILSTYSITGITSVADAGNYDVVVGSTAGFNCSSVTSSAATLAVNENGTISSPLNANQTVCSNSPITAITYTIGGSSTGAVLTGFLPAGVTYSFSGNVFTISGTPTEQGIFNYTVTTTGSPCVNPSLSGTITVDGIGTISLGGGTAAPTVCINNPISTITYSIGGNATGAVVSAGSLPTGVSGVYANGQFTISGTPTAAGTYPFTVSTTGSACGNPSLSGSITVNGDATIALTSANANQTVCIGSSISPISYTGGGSATGIALTGQLPAGVTGSTIGNVFTISGTPTATGTFNYTVTTTGPCSNTSLSGVIQVDYLADGGYLSPAVSTVCTTTNSGTLTLESYSGNIIQWEYSIDGGATWVIDPITTNTYTYTNLPNTTLFTALVGNGNCPALYSGIARVTVIPAFTPTITLSGGDVCSGEPVTLTGTAIILPDSTGVITGGDFNQSNPKGWRVTQNGVVLSPFPASSNNQNQNPWALTNGPKEFCGTIYDSADRKFSVVSGPFVSTMETPVFSLVAMSSAELTFKHAYNLPAGATAQVEISTDGGDTYSNVLAQYSGTLTSGNPNVVNPVDVDLSPYLGMSNLRIRFNYQSTTCSSWAVDGINLPSPQPDVDYAWGPTELIPGGSGSTIVVLPPTTTTYTLTVWIAGCPGVATGAIVTVVNNPEVQTTNACVGGGPVTFTHSSAINGGTWTVSGGGSITSDGVFTPTEPGCFEATYTTPNAACSGSASFVVFPAAPAPQVNIGCGPIVVTPPPSVYGFDVEYSFNNGATWGPNTPPTQESCNAYYIKTRYVIATACYPTPVGEVSSNTVCSESTATVRIIDYSDPTFTVPADITIYKDAGCNYDASTGVTGDVTDESDNCLNHLNATYTDIIKPGQCEDELIIERTWLLENGCGKQNVQIQRITVSDDIPPVISTLAANNQSNCSTGNPNVDPGYQAWLSSRGGAAATDNCDQILTWSNNSATQSWIGVAGSNQITITWVVTDNCGNTAETTATYSITDTQAPTVVCPASISETALLNGCDKILVTPSDPTINDNCPDPVLTYTLSGATTQTTPVVGTVEGVTFNVGITIVTYTATDAAGNESEPCSFTVTILDVTPPNLTISGCVNVSESAAANNCSKIPVTIIDPIYSDDCWPLDSLTLSWTMNGATTGSGYGSVVGQTFNVGVTRVTYQVEDPDGNTATCSFTVTILDVTAPNLTIGGCVNVTESATANNCSTIPVTIINPTYSDDCWPVDSLTLSWTMSGATTGSGNGSVVGQTFNVGVTTVTYQVEDPDGNRATCSFNVTILDINPPIFTVGCPDDVIQNADPGLCTAAVIVPVPEVTDPCNEGYVLTNDFNNTDDASGNYPVGTTIVTWTIRDNSGNTTICEQTVTVNDLPPTISCPAPIIAEADFELPYQDQVVVPTPTYSDNCPNPILTWTLVPPPAYASQYTLSQLSGTGNYPSPSLFYLGITTITYTVTDSNGATATCSFTVSVLEEPEITCLPGVSYTTDSGVCTATRSSDDFGLPTLVRGLQPITWTWTITNPDSTPGATGSFIANTGTPGPPSIPDYAFEQGVSTITWRAQNVSGFDECTQTVTVTDNLPPTFTAPLSITECVESIFLAVYNPNPTPGIIPEYNDITTPRPDYFLFTAHDDMFDLDFVDNNFNDNCCADEDLTIHWRIVFAPTPNPATAAHELITQPAITDQTGQPSLYPSNIQFPGDGVNFQNVVHQLIYWLVDCNGNPSEEQTVNIIVQPRPNLTKVTD